MINCPHTARHTNVDRSHQAVYTDDLLNLAAKLEAENGNQSGERRYCYFGEQKAILSIELDDFEC